MILTAMPRYFLSVLILIGIVTLIPFLLISSLLGLWIQAYFAQANIKLVELIGMRLRKVNPRIIVKSKIMGIQAGLDLTTRDLESHYLAGGDVSRLVAALIAASRGGVELTFKTAASIDLAGRDVLGEVRALVKSTENGMTEQEDDQDVEDLVFEDEKRDAWPDS
ncbi:MAG: flotillin-like FloA family protein [Planctomycetota bacterium]